MLVEHNPIMHELETKAVEWNVNLDEVRETPTSLIGFGVRGGVRVVLKITKQDGDESHSGEVLKAYRGEGAVRVFESEPNAVLLERLEPGEQLVNLVKHGRDAEATNILAEVIAKLANHEAPVGCPTVIHWGRAFDRYLQSDGEQIPRKVVEEAREMYEELASSQGQTMLLHGDLQHYNILFDNERGWVAIDPKGVIGELEYELGALLRNPIELPDIFANSVTINRRLETLTTTLRLDYSRALRWSYAQSILSVIWDIEDGHPLTLNTPSLLLASSLKQILSPA
ncbi:MAG TPA: aminoglycoside phosphotransferase family protein [Pyrinomonadaceae bacterium]|jgi:streptomycin 6-kinase